MRSWPVLSDTTSSLSFFLTTPAKKPRTECCSQPVPFISAAMVAPFGCRSIRRMVSCFDEAPVDLADACLGVVTLLAALRFTADDLIVRDSWAVRFTDFDLALMIAMSLSFEINGSISRH